MTGTSTRCELLTGRLRSIVWGPSSGRGAAAEGAQPAAFVPFMERIGLGVYREDDDGAFLPPGQARLPGGGRAAATADGTADAYLVHPDDGRAHPGVLVYQDAFGLRPHLKAMADRLAASGYTVLVPNVFYRHGRAPVVELPEFIDMEARPDIVGKVVPLMEALTPELTKRDSGAYLAWFADSPLATDAPVGITGYCMGARLALYTAGTHPDRVAAAAGFHGGGLASQAPDSPHLLADRITAELYFAHADEDPSMPEEQVSRLDQAFADAGVKHRCEVYEGAHHGYTQSDTAAYNPEAAERHWTELLALFARAL